MNRQSWIPWLLVFSIVNNVELENSEECPKLCQSALGFENGTIKDNDFSAFSVYNDSSRFGAHRARLNLNTWPPGYRADNKAVKSGTEEPWLMVKLGREVVITGIATQGYGDELVSEWVTSYSLMYAADEVFSYFKDTNGSMELFDGNQDSNTIVRHDILVPAATRTLLLLPSSWHNNIALRMEVYGCNPGYYFETWLLLTHTPFLMQHLNSSSDEHRKVASEVTDEVHSFLKMVGGYLYNSVLRLRPQACAFCHTVLTAVQIAIYCTESSVHSVTTKLNQSISQGGPPAGTPTFFEPNYVEINYPFACDCQPPAVKLPLRRSLSESNIVYTTNRAFHLVPKVTTNCSTSNQTNYKWMLFKVDPQTNTFRSFNIMMSTRRAIQLMPLKVDAENLFVGLKVVMAGVSGTSSYDYGFIRIRRPELVAKIEAPKSIGRNDTVLTLDSSGSYDPETKSLHYKGLNFSWGCHRNCSKRFLGICCPPKVESEPCFGIASDTDSVLTTKKAIRINVASLKSGCTYIFKLSVAKDGRISHAEHAVEVKSTVSFSIRCISNCLKKVSPNRILKLEVFCGRISCASIATFSWTIEIRVSDHQGNFIWQELKKASRLISTSADTTQFYISRVNGLIPVKDGQKLQIKVKSYDHTRQQQEQEVYSFLVNGPPKHVQGEDSSCKVTPREGEGIITNFTITCLGWYDEDTPLRYAFKYNFSSSTIIIQDGSVGNVVSKLPLGDRNKGYERRLELQIIDAFGEFASVFVQTKVRPPAASEGLLETLKKAENQMELLVKNKDVDKAADMAITMLSVVDNNDHLKQDERFKDSVLRIMAGVEVNRLNLVTKVAVITAYSTKRVNNSIPQSTQENALTLLIKSTTFLATMKNVTAKEAKIGKEINVNILTGIGNVMMASAKDAKITGDEKKPDIDKEKSKSITKKCINLVEVMKDDVIESEGICENPVVITTPFLNLTACIERANNMKVQNLLKGENGVKLPDPSILFAGQELDNNSVIDVKLTSFRENPYTWHVNSRLIRSSVLDVSLKNVTSGKVIRVGDLKKPVQLFIKNWEREEEERNKDEKKKLEEIFFVKPSPPHSIRNMRFHKIYLSLYKDMETNIKIIPLNNEKLEVYIRNRVRPTPLDNNFRTLVPDFSSCLNYTERGGFYNCFSDPYLIRISPKVTGHTGTHYIGIRYFPKPPKNNGTRVKRGCRDIGGRRHKRSCVEVKSPPSVAKLVIPEFQNGTDVRYKMTVTMGACMYWSEKEEEWTDRGCKIGSKNTVGKIHCLCNHLSAFGGDFFVAPNPIEFDKVLDEFARLGETGNFVVLSFVCLVFGVFAVGLVFARRADNKDHFEVVPNIQLLTAGDAGQEQSYDISIKTGIWRGSGTTANVTIVLFGENGCTPPILLSHNYLEKKFFARGSVNNFTIYLTESLGPLFKIKIWHDNSGKSPAWFFHQVLITCNATDEKWSFLGNRWLALEKGDGEVEAEIVSAGRKESLAFRNLFYFRSAKTLSEKHLWLSLFVKAPHSTFTRCQRLSCCLSILFATMVTNAMFYKQGVGIEDAFKIGPFKVSWTQIKIGLQSGLVAIPVNVFVVALFRNIKPPASNGNNGNSDPNDLDEKPSGCFPHFCVYVGWALCLTMSFVSGAFVVFYSLMWGKEVANQWLTSVMISFFEDVIVIQPIKVVVLASLLSLILRKPVGMDEVYVQGLSSHKVDKGSISYPPRNEELHRVRSMSVLKSRLVRAVVEIAIFIVFLSLLMMVCYGNRDKTRYQLMESMNCAFTGFEKVNSITSFWDWTKQHLLEDLFDARWYNGRHFVYKEGYISNREAFMVGMPRLRQKRIKRDPSCQVSDIEPKFIQRFHRCIQYYSAENEDKTKYHMQKWIPVHNESYFESLFQSSFLCPRPWRYLTAEELQTLSFQGLSSVYSGGGYVADLGYNREDAYHVIESLESNNWIDNMTAAIFIEFTVYEPATSLFSAVKLLFERFPNGGTNSVSHFKTLTIYSPQDVYFRGVYETCKLLFMLLILFCVGKEVVKIYQGGCKYFKDPWSWLEIILLGSSVLSLAVFFLKESYTSKFVAEVKKNPFQSWSTDNIALWSDLEVMLLSFVVFLVTMKLLRIIRFNPHIIQMRMTLINAAKFFWSFIAVFLTVIIAYVMLTTLAFGGNVEQYRSFLRSFGSVLLMLIGAKAPFDKLRSISIFIGPFFVFAYMVSIVMILLNMFLAILNDAYIESRKQGQQGLQDAAISKIVNRKAKRVVMKTREVLMNIFQALPKLLWRKHSETTVTFECEEWNGRPYAVEEDPACGISEDESLRDIVALLKSIKNDISDSVLSLDDIVPMITIHDPDEKWINQQCYSDDEDGRFYSYSSLYQNESKRKHFLTSNKSRSLRYNHLIMDEWDRRNLLFGETFV